MSKQFIFCIMIIVASIKSCKKLLSMVLMENNLTDLPESLAEVPAVQTLELGNNCFPKLPSVVTKLKSLTKLTFPYMMLTGELFIYLYSFIE